MSIQYKRLHKRLNKRLINLCIICSCLFINNLDIKAQSNSTQTRTNNFIAIGFQYGLAFPAGDLSARFGNNFNAAVSLDMYNMKLNGFWGLEAQFQFGSKVREDVLSSLRSTNGVVLGVDGGFADVFMRRRGIYLGAYINKTIFPTKDNKLAGLNIGLGAGLWQHHIRFQNDSQSANQIKGDYAKGYDRLTRGPALKQTITYQNIGKSKRVNFSIGLSVMEGFTKSVRAINFDTQESAAGSRLDMLISLEGKWFIPLRESGSAEDLFY